MGPFPNRYLMKWTFTPNKMRPKINGFTWWSQKGPYLNLVFGPIFYDSWPFLWLKPRLFEASCWDNHIPVFQKNVVFAKVDEGKVQDLPNKHKKRFEHHESPNPQANIANMTILYIKTRTKFLCFLGWWNPYCTSPKKKNHGPIL